MQIKVSSLRLFIDEALHEVKSRNILRDYVIDQGADSFDIELIFHDSDICKVRIDACNGKIIAVLR